MNTKLSADEYDFAIKCIAARADNFAAIEPPSKNDGWFYVESSASPYGSHVVFARKKDKDGGE